ncbi:MAG: PAS domain-containing protein [Alphaproteobacteria bacterium]|nr:PAS domain-containing protein [Alphaproteobacteria bacterium]
MNFNIDLVARSPIESLIACLDVPVVIGGIHSDVICASQSAAALIGGDRPTSIVGIRLQDVLCPSFRNVDLAWFEASTATGTSPDHSALVHFVHASGHGTWSAKPMQDANGKSADFICQHINSISDADIAPGVTKTSENLEIHTDTDASSLPVPNELRWRTAVLSANQGVWDHDFERNQHYMSHAWRTMRGFKEHATVPETTEDRLLTIHPDDVQKIKQQLHLQDTGATDIVNYTFRKRHADGHWISILSHGRVVRRDARGQPVHIIGTDTDITEMKMVEEECRRLAERFSLAMEAANIGHWEFDIDSDRTV